METDIDYYTEDMYDDDSNGKFRNQTALFIIRNMVICYSLLACRYKCRYKCKYRTG